MDVTPRRIVIWMHISLFSKKKSEKPPSISSVPDPSQRMPHHAGRSGDDRTRVVHSIMGILNYRKTMTHSFASYVVTGPEIAGHRCQSCAVQASISSRTCITTFQTLHPVSSRPFCFGGKHPRDRRVGSNALLWVPSSSISPVQREIERIASRENGGS